MPNGSYSTDAQPAPPSDVYPDVQPNIITLNLGLKARHIVTAFSIISGILASGGLAGYLFIPARQDDMIAIQKQVLVIDQSVKSVQDVAGKLTDAMARLGDQVQALIDRPIPSEIPTPKRKRRAAAED